MTIEKQIGQWWCALFEESMQQVGAKEKAMLFTMKGTTRESQQSQSLLMGAGVNAPINTRTMHNLGGA